MKRALASIVEDQQVRDMDSVLRAQIAAEQEADDAAQRKALEDASTVKSLQSDMKKWKEMKLVSLDGFRTELPVMVPFRGSS